MNILTLTEAKAAKVALKAIGEIGTPYFSITLGEGGAKATVECDEGIITIKNHKTTEVYTDIKLFSQKYGV